MTAAASWPALGTNATVVVADAAGLAAACRSVRAVLEEIDRAASRFREDSEISVVNRAGGAPVLVSGTFVRAARCALRAARITGGDLDPTVGASLRIAGYDRDFTLVGPGVAVRFAAAAGWRAIELDDARHLVRVPAGVELDFGATAKALAADMAAARASAGIAGGGVLVSLGGDIATAGPAPAEGWSVHVTDDHAAGPGAAGQTIALRSGGLATSSTTRRRWTRGSTNVHHILDPATGAPAREHWRTVSVAAACCVDANIASTTSIIRGAAAPAWLEGFRLPARLVAGAGAVTVTCGWPIAERAAA
jgi:thiamine biosynthesis lipoprotein